MGDAARTDNNEKVTEDIPDAPNVAKASSAPVAYAAFSVSQSNAARVRCTVLNSRVLQNLDSTSCFHDSLFHQKEESLETPRLASKELPELVTHKTKIAVTRKGPMFVCLLKHSMTRSGVFPRKLLK